MLEEFVQEEFSGFDQKDHPMTLEDVGPYLDDLAALHASCWDTPIEDKPGLRDYAAHWGSLDAQFPQMWGIMEAEYEATFGHTLWAEVTEEEGAAVKELSGLLAGEHGPKINAALLARFRSRPRSITHGDARGQNVFREKAGERKFALIDWQMWVAGPVAYEFNQVWMNSFDPGSGVTERFEELMAQYHATLVRLEPRAAEYTLETLLADVKLQLWCDFVTFPINFVTFPITFPIILSLFPHHFLFAARSGCSMWGSLAGCWPATKIRRMPAGRLTGTC